MSLPPQILRYCAWLASTRGLRFDPTTTAGYDVLWQWSIGDVRAFWRSIWDYFEIESPTAYTNVLDTERMPGARFFGGAHVNYARHLFRHADASHAAGHPAIVFQSERMRERGELQELSWPQLRREVASLAARLAGFGVGPGDRVAAILTNSPQAVIGFLATVSIGAVWSVCSPELGAAAMFDRFRQIAPKVLIACDGYVYGGVEYDRMPLVRGLLDQLPSVTDVVLSRYLRGDVDPHALASKMRGAHDLASLVGDDPPFEPAWVAFDHPLWIVYSSGTTGLPKPIVHGHGGVMLEALKVGGLHNDLGPSRITGDRYCWNSSPSWIMWNAQLGALLLGTTVCMYDGSPSGKRGSHDWSTLWRFAAESHATFFGAGAAFYVSCLKGGVRPAKVANLSRLRAIGSTGSPLSEECYRWIENNVPTSDGCPIWITSISGGTDFAGAFLGGMVTLPVVAGEMQCRCLGAAVEAWSEPDEQGRGTPLLDEVGELTCRLPLPSMPLSFWGDVGNTRLLQSYFGVYPGIWRHGDWLRITPRGGAIIYGRSDATINRHGIRIGSSEIYDAVEALDEVVSALVVDLEYLGRPSYMPLFVVLRQGVTLDDVLTRRMAQAIKLNVSPRVVPDEVFQVPAIPTTINLKKLEVPVKKLLLGGAAETLFNFDTMQNPESVPWFVEFAARRRALEARS